MLNVQPTCITGPSILEMLVPPDDHQDQQWWIEAHEKEDGVRAQGRIREVTHALWRDQEDCERIPGNLTSSC